MPAKHILLLPPSLPSLSFPLSLSQSFSGLSQTSHTQAAALAATTTTFVCHSFSEWASAKQIVGAAFHLYARSTGRLHPSGCPAVRLFGCPAVRLSCCPLSPPQSALSTVMPRPLLLNFADADRVNFINCCANFHFFRFIFSLSLSRSLCCFCFIDQRRLPGPFAHPLRLQCAQRWRAPCSCLAHSDSGACSASLHAKS